MRDCRPQRKNGSCSPHRSGQQLNSYDDIVRDYRDKHRQDAAHDLQFYAAEQPTLADVIKLAGLAKTADGKRQSHQRRIPESALRLAHTALKSCDLNTCPSFDGLLETVNNAIRSICGIGELTVYDTACRIGAYLRLYPQKVYLHAGTRVGARALGLGRGTYKLEINELPAPFRRLTAGEIEDCLCIYKDDLKRINNTM